MKGKSGKSLGISFLLFTLALPAFGQRQTGSIHGIVTDREGDPLPGATVTISSPALMGTNDYMTSEAGLFRFPVLAPGEYEIKVSLPGFKGITRKGINVSVGKTVEIEVQMEVSAIEEQITVTAESPVVDVQATKINVNYSSQFLASLPMNRDLYDIQNSIPGAISEGVDYRRTSSILGGTVRSQLYALDGVPMNDPATFYSMVNINVDVYDEIEFEIGSHPAEVGQTDSTYINIVTKSGGNKFSGNGVFYYTNKSLAQDMFSKEQIEALNVNPPEKFTNSRDFSLNLGGPILKDKIWFFVNGRRLLWDQAYPGTPETRMARLGFTSSPHYDLSHQEWLGFGKLTFQVGKKIKYMGMLHYNHIYEPTYTNSAGTSNSFEYTEIWDHENTYTTTHQLNWVFNQNTFADIRGTYVYRYFPILSRTQGQPSIYDYKEQVWWGSSPYNDEYVRKKYLASASITRFQDDFLGMSHELKGGVEFEQSEYHRDWYRSNPYYTYWNDYAKKDPYYVSTTRFVGRLRIRTCPPTRGQWDVQDHVRRFSGYIQDSLLKGRLALNIGMRFDHSFQYEPEQTRPQLRFEYGPDLLAPGLGPNALIEAMTAQLGAEGKISPFESLTTPYKKVVTFTTLSPRLGFVYDLFGNRKTALKVSFARYFEPLWSAKYNGGQIFGASSFQWDWYDLNKNKLMDLPPTDSYVLTSYSEQDPNFRYYEFVGKDGTTRKLKSPYMNEAIAGIEHELFKDFKLGLQFMWKENKNIVDDFDILNGYDPTAKDEKGLIWLPFTFTDPGWDRKFGTVDDQQLTVYGLRADRPAPVWKGTNPPEAKRKYLATVLTFDKRMSNRWQLTGSILFSSFKGNAWAEYSPTEGESTQFDSPNSLVNGYGRLGFDRPLQIKLMATYLLPLDFILSAYFQYRSGSPWERTLARVYFPQGFGARSSYVAVNAETPGSQRNPTYSMLDLRIEKDFRIRGYGKINVYVDIFNIGGRSGVNVNQNPAAYVRYDQTPVAYTLSTTYGLVTSCYGVRSIRAGLRYTF